MTEGVSVARTSWTSGTCGARRPGESSRSRLPGAARRSSRADRPGPPWRALRPRNPNAACRLRLLVRGTSGSSAQRDARRVDDHQHQSEEENQSLGPKRPGDARTEIKTSLPQGLRQSAKRPNDADYNAKQKRNPSGEQDTCVRRRSRLNDVLGECRSKRDDRGRERDHLLDYLGGKIHRLRFRVVRHGFYGQKMFGHRGPRPLSAAMVAMSIADLPLRTVSSTAASAKS